MASVDGSKSLKAASDELFDHVCDPCGDEGVRLRPNTIVESARSFYAILV